eukprot:gnl/TRDRNA2_/TRDRNA2_135754_c0_seq1.p1 gnl/TRDRNA2_/TRDRNA2_135754_c0~~gnl/TRDRNA2_/TRDRNA2_135754_c0_seq1.p1  ORF type:complete len:486 (+),score=92.60 gnl/TRDRNA2_/TRDRNA2_135754_c0_seq1:105-1562(+)
MAPHLPAIFSSDVDVRVGTAVANPWMHGVNLRDMLGGSLVTFDEHIAPSQEMKPLPPKAVYLQYQIPDPVTGTPFSTIVPAHLSLDVFADPSLLGIVMEEDDESEEDAAEQEDDERGKMRTSVRGDPILMRAKPAPPPEPYFAPLRYEMSQSRGSAGLSWKERGSRRTVPDVGTMSSFRKASGRDKYSHSRLPEIDAILARSLPHPHLESQSPLRPGTTGTEDDPDGGGGRGFRGPRSLLPLSWGEQSGGRPPPSRESLVSDMALRIQRMPQFHNGAARTPRQQSAGNVTAQTPRQQSADEPPAAEASPEVGGASSPSSPPCSARSVKRSRGGLRPKAVTALHQLDPHIDHTDKVPTQRLHSNWPDGQRRQLARYFYGMSADLILEEEEKERQRDHLQQSSRRATAKDHAESEHEADAEETSEHDHGTKGEAATSAKAKAIQSRLLEQRLARGAENGGVAHRLEVRIRNSNQPNRVVVMQSTERQ